MTRRDIFSDQHMFQNLVIPRLRKMITPALEHAIPVALDTSAGVEWALADLHKAGIKIIQFTNPDLEALERLVAAWHGKIVFIGGLPASRLGVIPRAEVDEMIRKYHKKFARHSGFAFGPDEPLPGGDEYPPQNFVNMLRTVQQLSGD